MCLCVWVGNWCVGVCGLILSGTSPNPLVTESLFSRICFLFYIPYGNP